MLEGHGGATSRGAALEAKACKVQGRTHVIQQGRRGDAAHDRPRAHDGCGVRELSPIMLAARESSSELRRRRSRCRQRAESAVVGRGRARRRRHYGQRRRHRRMCRGRHGDDPVQESSSHRSQTTSTFGREDKFTTKTETHRSAAASPVREQRESTFEREMGLHLGHCVRICASAFAREQNRYCTLTVLQF